MGLGEWCTGGVDPCWTHATTGGLISWLIGILFAFCSGSVRALYGPSSPHAEYVADSCSNDITVIGCFGEDCKATVLPGVPTCGEWKPDPYAALKMFTCTKVCPPA